MKYRWRAGARFHSRVDPQAAGERLASLKQKMGGSSSLASFDGIPPEAVVEDARREDSPLHAAFDWDVQSAAHKHHLEIARLLCRSIRYVAVKIIDGERVEQLQRIYVNVRPGRNEKAESCYVEVSALKDRVDLREQVLQDALRSLRAFRSRYSELSELSGIMREIDSFLEEHEQSKSAEKREGLIR